MHGYLEPGEQNKGDSGSLGQTPPYKWWNWHDNYDAEASPDPKWVQVSDAAEAAFREHDAEAKACPRSAKRTMKECATE